MKQLLQTLFFFLAVTQICFAQWYQQNSGTTANLNSVHFEDVNNGWAVGDSGIILHTTNGGQEWIAQTSGTDRWLRSVSFTDLNNGTTVGGGENDTTEEGIILRTTNGGMTWFQQTSGTMRNLAGVSFSDSNNGWAVGGYWVYRVDSEPIFFGTILHTTNGGTTWAEQLSGETSWLSGVSFTDANNGTAVGASYGFSRVAGVVLRTTNGGTNWVRQLKAIRNYALHGVSFTDANNGTVIGGRYVQRTTDGGTTWVLQSSGNYSLYGVFFTDANNGTAVGWDGIIIRTTNGGTTWIAQTNGTKTILRSVSFTDANNGWAVGDNGTILHTTNGGNPVPVELNSFTATASNKEIILNWTTATELNNYGFEVQRKAVGGDFATVAFVKGQGTTTQQNQYSFLDKNLDEGKYSYRLKQVDFSGTFEYSKAIEVEVITVEFYSLEQNYPNPFNPSTTISYGLKEKSNVKLTLLNSLGEEITVLVNEELDKGFHKIDFNASTLASGVYFYQLKAGNFIDTKKMILLR